jgi:hypothetical protein
LNEAKRQIQTQGAVWFVIIELGKGVTADQLIRPRHSSVPVSREPAPQPIQDSTPYSLFLNSLAEYAQKVTAADLSDIIRGEGGLQHGIDNDIVETGRFILPCLTLRGHSGGMGRA